MKISIGSDHAGFDLKEQLKNYLEEEGYEVIDEGCYSHESVDYPDFGKKVGKRVADKEADRGLVVCGSGIGISIAANKVSGIRCALVSEPLSARLARQHNDANVLALGGRLTGLEMAKECLKVFLQTDFEGGRHQRRIDKLV
ncbi:ribose 5-phosphate isomerase B [Neofamilia massiliensis]|uniref:ribose 5-phosphate isomerase B n=1 Tax=Neofamilia massiliensis TaxID=1673724 RepID=UPI0006BB5F71|nr:ribose 5-phosphate isomerase B [Neofamilia massiliensis]